MSNAKISGMTDAGSVADNDLCEMSQAAGGPTTKSWKMSYLKTYLWNAPVIVGAITQSSGASGYELLQRTAITTQAVPTFYPTTAASVIAFDLMPNGAPSISAGSAYAWADICDADVLNNTSTAVNYLHLAARTDALEVGSRSLYGGTGKPIVFNYQGTDKGWLNSAGFALGTSAAISPFTVSSNTSAPRAWTGSGTPQVHLLGADATATRILFDTFASVPILDFRRADGTNTSPSALLSGDTIGQIEFNGYNSSTYALTKGAILCGASENWSTSANGTNLDFFTCKPTTTTITRNLRIDGYGTQIQAAVTVANLPSASSVGVGARHFVTDSTVAGSGNFGATVTGGGSNAVPVYSDGTNWKIG